jgi:group I intron endonuclease
MINTKYKNLILSKELLKSKLYHKAGIYKLINTINGNCYIGSSNNLYRRISQHCNLKTQKSTLIKSKSAISAALLKYKPENFALVILKYIDFNENTSTKDKRLQIISSEQDFINSIKPNYNINPTAGSNLGRIFSDEVKQKMSLAKKGITSHWKGKQKSLESRALMVKNSTLKKTIYQYNSDGTFLRSYPSITAAVSATGIPRKRISLYAKQTTAVLLKENIIFSFIKWDKIPNISNIPNNKIKLYVYHANGSLFKVFNSISEGSLSTNISYKKIIKSVQQKVPIIIDDKYIFSLEPLN